MLPFTSLDIYPILIISSSHAREANVATTNKIMIMRLFFFSATPHGVNSQFNPVSACIVAKNVIINATMLIAATTIVIQVKVSQISVTDVYSPIPCTIRDVITSVSAILRMLLPDLSSCENFNQNVLKLKTYTSS